MSLHDSSEKINPVKDREGSQRPSVFNGVKSIITASIESERGKDALIVIIVILVGLVSFELGRLSKNSTGSGLKIEYRQSSGNEANVVSSNEPAYALSQNTATSTGGARNTSGKVYFASNRGQKYYSIGCSAGKTIKQENRIWFTTEAEAIKAGYSKSSAC